MRQQTTRIMTSGKRAKSCRMVLEFVCSQAVVDSAAEPMESTPKAKAFEHKLV